jgi:hypothetical protein
VEGWWRSAGVDLDVFAFDDALSGSAEEIAFSGIEVVVFAAQGAAGVGGQLAGAPEAGGGCVEVAVEDGLEVVVDEVLEEGLGVGGPTG